MSAFDPKRTSHNFFINSEIIGPPSNSISINGFTRLQLCGRGHVNIANQREHLGAIRWIDVLSSEGQVPLPRVHYWSAPLARNQCPRPKMSSWFMACLPMDRAGLK